MIAIIASYLPWEWIGGAVAACLAIAGAWMAGGKSQRQKAKIDAQSGWIDTGKKVQNAGNDSNDDSYVIRKRMRDRPADKR